MRNSLQASESNGVSDTSDQARMLSPASIGDQAFVLVRMHRVSSGTKCLVWIGLALPRRSAKPLRHQAAELGIPVDGAEFTLERCLGGERWDLCPDRVFVLLKRRQARQRVSG